ncbi:FtsX-like permease family protein [Flavobacteriaceae bacterium TP-CH-4]|uniref:FtsX-like permease family protein n=1 Tax=Pelagihabitans pacificus TaxID=2696054 RepID=A0A967ATB9_9FLAO|nr:ABC transporter permease [Pelagihabitans pacificus]NHF59918.1 FtsX-like permease family protein [Pelagihabitans pacificus]
MLKNHFKIAWRNIKKDKLFTFIKIGGFAIGIAACLLITLFVSDELAYDRHYLKKNRIFRVYTKSVVDGELEQDAWHPAPFARALTADFPEIKKSGRLLNSELFGAGSKELRLEGDDQSNFEQGFVFVDQELLEILEIPFSQGNSENALSEPNTIVISGDKAAKYFPEGNAIGKSVVLDNDPAKSYRITGVMQETDTNSHFDYDFLLTTEGRDFYPGEDDNWAAQNYFTYVLLEDGVNTADLEKKLVAIVEDYLAPLAREMGSISAIEYLKNTTFGLQPIAEIHLKSIDINDGFKHGDIRFIWLFAAIAGFILLLACINFINLSTAKSANRAKEVGLRKTVGAFKTNLVFQFLTEAILFSALSFILGTLLAWLLLPNFNSMAAKSITMPWGQWWFIPTLTISALLIGVSAGLYPSFYLSSFRPVTVLKGSISAGSKSRRLRSGLVVFQFTTSIILIIGTLIIHKQMDYILRKKLGYDKEQVLLIKGANTLGDKIQNFKEQLLTVNEVVNVSISDYLPVEGTKRNMNPFWKAGMEQQEKAVGGQLWRIDHDYLNTLGIQLKKGRNFSRELASDSTDAAIINESMARGLGFVDPIGEKVSNGQHKTIIGVVEDFHLNNLKEEIVPLVLTIGNSRDIVTVKLNTEKMDDALESITSIWRKNAPNQPIRYSFLDQDFALMHEDVRRIGKIFNSFAVFAILVACLGLFALSAFLVEQRKKEISIRLVLGAPFKSIYTLLTLNFLRLVFIAILIAVPIGWFMMSRWLEDFAYPIKIGWEIFVMAGVLSLIIALVTISYQSVGAALIQPSKSLRAE